LRDVPLYNSRLLETYTEYFKVYYPNIDLERILQSAGITPFEIEDAGHWFTQDDVDRFYEAVLKETGNPSIAREAGRFIASNKASGTLRQYVIGFLSPGIAYWMVEKVSATLSRAHQVSSRVMGPSSVKILFEPREGVQEKPYQCENRIGLLESMARVFTNHYAAIDHPHCIHRGDKICEYDVSWEISPFLVWRRIGYYATALSVILAAGLLFWFPLSQWSLAALLLALVTLGIFFRASQLEKEDYARNLKSQGNAADQLINEINRHYNEALLVQEIGQAASSILDFDQLLRFMMETLQKRLDYGRGMVMLADEERTRLTYTMGYGYRPEQEETLKKTFFHLNRPGSKGPFVLTFKDQKPFLVNDISQLENTISERTADYVRKLNVKSFLSVPIIYEGKSEGILAVDTPRSKRILNQSDLSLLMGIAPQIGISINNARTYQKIRESEERFRALGENSPDIIFTLNESGTVTYINPAWEKILGHPGESVLGRYFTDFLKEDPEEERQLIRAFKRVRNHRETVKGVRTVLLSKDGSERILSMSGSPNVDEKSGKVGFIGIMTDITALEKNLDMLQSALQSTIDAMSIIVEARDPYTAGHQRRVSELACAIAEEMNLPEATIRGIRMGSMIHDIGKIYIPAEILSKPGKLSKIEFDMMKTHPEVGYHILKSIEFKTPVAEMVYQHHEKLDGSGYPRGISGNEILLEARILAVSDVVEAMASHRPYRPSLGIEAALEEITRKKGVLFDRTIVDTCVRLIRDEKFRFSQEDKPLLP
jgi:PAS domain S-box-containing protein/putative nucleotidyltransferase with HDIG domain